MRSLVHIRRAVADYVDCVILCYRVLDADDERVVLGKAVQALIDTAGEYISSVLDDWINCCWWCFLREVYLIWFYASTACGIPTIVAV